MRAELVFCDRGQPCRVSSPRTCRGSPGTPPVADLAERLPYLHAVFSPRSTTCSSSASPAGLVGGQVGGVAGDDSWLGAPAHGAALLGAPGGALG